MRDIRRAAVTGLFALWLAPLSASAAAPNNPGLRADRTVQTEQRLAEARQDDEEEGDGSAVAAPPGKGS